MASCNGTLPLALSLAKSPASSRSLIYSLSMACDSVVLLLAEEAALVGSLGVEASSLPFGLDCIPFPRGGAGLLLFGAIWGFVTLTYDLLRSTIFLAGLEGFLVCVLRVLGRFLVMRFLAIL